MSTVRRSPKLKLPPRDEPQIHGEMLANSMRRAAVAAEQNPTIPTEGTTFVPVVMTSEPRYKLALESLDNRTVQLVNVRIDPEGRQIATVNVPKASVPKFVMKFELYAHTVNQRTKKPPNQPLAESITELRLAAPESGDYWMDSGPLPATAEQLWWEVWLRDDGEISTTDGRLVGVEVAFREEAHSVNIRVSDQQLRFPDYVVILVYTSLDILTHFPRLASLSRRAPASQHRA